MISAKPADSPQITALDAPSLDEGPYLSYWFQWWLFGVIAIGAWITIIRREAQHRDREAEDAEYDDAEYDEADEAEDEALEEGADAAAPATAPAP